SRSAARLRSCFSSSRRRHTRLQGDWSSDVCSSDLWFSSGCFATTSAWPSGWDTLRCSASPLKPVWSWWFICTPPLISALPPEVRSEERRVGKECGGRCWQEQE